MPLWGPDEGGIFTLVGFLWSNMFLGFGLLRILPTWLRQFYEGFLFVWMGLGLFLVMSVVLVIGTASLTSFAVSDYAIASSSLGLAVMIALFSFRSAQQHVVMPISLGLLPNNNSGNESTGIDEPQVAPPANEIRAVVLSDIHVSGLLGPRRIRRIVRQVNALDPDLIFVVGDLVDGSVRQLGDAVLEFRSMRTRQDGQVYYVTGNHEYYSGADAWKEFLRTKVGWNVLANESRSVTVGGHRLHILGLDDRQSLRGSNPLAPKKEDDRLKMALSRLPEQTPEGETVILLTHQPKDTDLVMDCGRVDFQVSGHTHAGQIWPFGFFVRQDQRYLRGLFEVRPGRYLYVCQGTGFWGLPFRLGTQCEIGLLRLQQQPS